jgi:hypothetical protein
LALASPQSARRVIPVGTALSCLRTLLTLLDRLFLGHSDIPQGNPIANELKGLKGDHQKECSREESERGPHHLHRVSISVWPPDHREIPRAAGAVCFSAAVVAFGAGTGITGSAVLFGGVG